MRRDDPNIYVISMYFIPEEKLNNEDDNVPYKLWEKQRLLRVCPGITLNKTSDSLTIGQTDNLVATTTSANATVTWSSSDSSIATVDQTGKVAGINDGTVTITATTDSGKTATCIINVTSGNTTPSDPTDGNGDVSIIFNGAPDTQLSVVKTADVKSVWVGDTFTYTIVVTNTG